ncbi:SRPBCC domain-containing protein [Acrocarpospora corrugata]|uniref:SRPBCC family protein n=1 Tax=Acrocarpospora corrugata TaxID=35763 RepID=UPI001C3F5416
MTAGAELRDDELIAERHLAAEPERVWAAFTSPANIAAFWGGSHATVPPESVIVDLRPGGEFALDTHANSMHFQPGGLRGRRYFVTLSTMYAVTRCLRPPAHSWSTDRATRESRLACPRRPPRLRHWRKSSPQGCRFGR